MDPFLPQRRNLQRTMPNDPEYTEFGIKIHKLRLTLKVQRRSSSATSTTSSQQIPAAAAAAAISTRSTRASSSDSRPRRRSRANSSSSSLAADSLRMLDLDSKAGSRRPVVHDNVSSQNRRSSIGTKPANWEFQGFYSPIRTSTPSSGYSSTAISRTSSFSSEVVSQQGRLKKLTSADDSAYSEVYSTIEELSELPDPFDDDKHKGDDAVSTLKAKHPMPKIILPAQEKPGSRSMTSLLQEEGGHYSIPDKPKYEHKKTKSSMGLAESRYHHENPSCSPGFLDDSPHRCQSKSTGFLSGIRIGHVKTKSSTCLLDDRSPHHRFQINHKKTKSSSSVLSEMSNSIKNLVGNTRSKSNGSLQLPDHIPPPLPPRTSRCRPPARPPYPSTIVRAVQNIAKPLQR